MVGDLKGNILDIGSGTGFIGQKFDVFQLDIAYNMCLVSNNNLTVNADMHNIPFANKAFDYCVSSSAIQWKTTANSSATSPTVAPAPWASTNPSRAPNAPCPGSTNKPTCAKRRTSSKPA